MYIQHVVIKNFRAIEDLSTDLNPNVNVIVGPNGVGKTTILQAIRLSKAIVAPRTQQETLQVLISLSAASPHFPQRLILNNLARDPGKPVEVRCTYHLTADEVALLKTDVAQITQAVVGSRLGQTFTNPAQLVLFLQSQPGQQAFQAAKTELEAVFARLSTDPTLVVGVTFDMTVGGISAADPLAGSLLGHLDQRLPPSATIFSYFPADRALPMGEVGLQLGGPDAQQQLESHNSQPQLKYQRLKNVIINSLLIGTENGRTARAHASPHFRCMEV